MSVVVVTGSAGLIGSEASRYFAAKGFDIAGIDNDMRSVFFGAGASTNWVRDRLVKELPNYTHYDTDVRDTDSVLGIFEKYGKDISLVIYAAAQPSHDWAAKDPMLDFTVNANGTQVVLEATRRAQEQLLDAGGDRSGGRGHREQVAVGVRGHEPEGGSYLVDKRSGAVRKSLPGMDAGVRHPHPPPRNT